LKDRVVVKVHCAHTHLKTHTSEDTHTPEETHTPEMYLETESEENADNENEDQRQCLVMEVDNPEIDDITRGMFGYENMLYEMCIYEI